MTTETNQLIFNLSMQLLQQDLLTNTLFAGGQVGQDLRRLLIAESSSLKITDPSREALSGKLRSDAGMLSQASQNVSEAKSLIDSAESALETIRESITSMQDIAEKVADGTYSLGAADAEYAALVSTINGAIQAASYNGINLLDGTNWGTDERLTTTGTIGAPDAYGKITIQAGSDSFELSLNDLSFITTPNFTGSLSSLSGLTMTTADIASTGEATNSASELSELLTYVQTIESLYEGRSSNLSSQSSALSSQSSILTTAANTREQTNDQRTLEELVLDYIINNVGSVINTSS